MATSTIPADLRSPIPWLFSPAVDLLTFLGSALLALGLLAVGAPFGLLESDTPDWMWVGAILMIDVAHVYSTGFRVYFDVPELKRRPWLYGLTPLFAFLFGMAIYSEGSGLFWRTLAYLAVFHFVRQQYGWIALYRSRAGETGRIGYWIDTLAIYMATLYPLIHWHSHLPRNFWWFLEGDFQRLPAVFESVAAPIYWASLVAYGGRIVYRGVIQGQWSPGKDIVLITTAICWYVGIITFNSDYAFTVTNVIIHGIPYMVLVYWYRCVGTGGEPRRHFPRVAAFLGVVWMLAYLEEFLWDCGVWHERSWFFGPAWTLENLDIVLIPLLAVPQITHYVLDGFIWKRKSRRHLV
ncbi:MAG: hypothetical protein OSA98_24950 [Rubripirellula sp.]|nr:hypothetical protein [Rubripirellula sp.]